jgi:multicomponent Na+:H+ antiporter subunit B
MGVPAARKALRLDPIAIAGAGVLLAGLSGLVSLVIEAPFMTSIWLYLPLGDAEVPLSTPLFFDLGVYLTVFGALTSVGLALASEVDEEDL